MKNEIIKIADDLRNGEIDTEAAQTLLLSLFSVSSRKPIAWGCKTCNKIDWADSKEQLAKPEHISYRGIDLGNCKGKFIPLYGY